MAASNPTSQRNHARSTSLPSKPHPLILQCNEHLAKLEASEAASSSFNHKLGVLQDLHDCVEKLVQISHTRDVLVEERGEDELLDGSLRLLDACTAAKDALFHTKECAREVQSIMRRKRGGEIEAILEVKKYLTSRKVVKKAIFKALSNLKCASNKHKVHYHDQSGELVRLLKDVEVVTISVLESLLNFISGPTQSSKSGNWSLVSKLMMKNNKRVSCTREEAEENEFARVDTALQSFVFHHTSSKSENINHLQKQLEDLESVIQDFVEGLENLFRRFIKTRVALLNILSH